MKLFRSKIVLFAVGIVAAGCLFMGASYVFGGPNLINSMLGAIISPVQRGLNSIGDFFGDTVGYFYRYDALQEENARLRAQLAEYRNLELEFNAAISQNTQLREMLSLKMRRRDLTCEPCNIISDISSLRSSFTIDKGSLSDISVGDSVMTIDGLVGYVSEVELSYSEVVTILDISSKVGAMVSRTREAAVAEGSFELMSKGQLKLAYLKNDCDIKPGDWIETSGFGGMYPKGVLVGRVLEFLPEAHGISSYATIEPIVNIEELRGVFVVRDFEIVE